MQGMTVTPLTVDYAWRLTKRLDSEGGQHGLCHMPIRFAHLGQAACRALRADLPTNSASSAP